MTHSLQVHVTPPQLEDGVHYIKVNAGSITDTVNALLADDAKAKAIAAQGLDWYTKHLRAQDVKVRLFEMRLYRVAVG